MENEVNQPASPPPPNGTNCMKCGRSIPPWWDKEAFPIEDEDKAFEVWRLTPCECGYSPDLMGVKR